MDQSSPSNSRIPRLSRLPVPSAGLRSSISRENLQQSQPPKQSIINPRLRGAPSRDNLTTSFSQSSRLPSTPSKRRESSSTSALDHDVSTEADSRPLLRKPSRNTLFKKPSQSFLREGSLRPQPLEEDLDQGAQGVIQVHAVPLAEIHSFGQSRKPRPSLSERTMETLQKIPSSPALRKRNSSFFRPESPMRPPSSGAPSSRPGSSYDPTMRPPSRAVSSRPTSSSSSSVPLDFRASTNTFKPPQASFQALSPLKKPTAAKSIKTPSNIRTNIPLGGTSVSKLPSPNFGSSMQARSPSLNKTFTDAPVIKPGSKTVSARSLKPRASVNGLFRKPSMPAINQSAELDRIGFVAKRKPATVSNASSENALSEPNSNSSLVSKVSTTTTTSVDNNDATPRKSSMALRDQIAKAKAAKRAAATKQAPPTGVAAGDEVPVIASGTFDFGLSDDPFNQHLNLDNAKGLLRKRVDAARTDGRLNIAAMGLKTMPEEVMNMYTLEAIGTQDGAWAESVDLTRLIAADNEFESLDDVFPDIDPRENADDEDTPGNIFGGLETADLHGNLLMALPPGLRRLELLTTLNLSNNKLGNACFEILGQITSLRDLKISGNVLSGLLPASITNLKNLETLEIKANALTSFPDDFGALSRLRVLNITENKFASLPFESLGRLPLTELLAAKNKLTGALISADIGELPSLQILDVTANSLTSLDLSGTLKLPTLHQLSCSSNRLTGLPDVTSWTALLNIAAEDNNIASLPEGFVALPKVKSVDFSGNDLKILDDRIGGMETLDVFRVSGNPLREKKFSGMSTDDLKRALKARITPIEPQADAGERDQDSNGSFYSAPVSPMSPRPTSSHWPVKMGGILDRSNTKSHSLNPVTAAEVAANNAIKILELHHNNFKEIPSSIAFFAATLTTLSLAHNELDADRFMNDDLELPVLKELNLSSNTFDSLQPLIQHLHAPQMERLDVSFNRLITLPPLKVHFPSLITLLASNNTIRELSPEAVKGLRTLDCSSNEISSLNARIGLLGGPNGLQRLDVKGNRFRVPKYTILEKGTEATLTWLKDRIPVGETSAEDVD